MVGLRAGQCPGLVCVGLLLVGCWWCSFVFFGLSVFKKSGVVSDVVFGVLVVFWWLVVFVLLFFERFSSS